MAVEYNPKVVTDGLVLALDAGNTKSYPGSGSTWTDTIGSNNGTLTNGPTFGSSDNGGSILILMGLMIMYNYSELGLVTIEHHIV